jgi:2-polyprenyl-3-methyl-5-hydroxy-6-metoxy-1,4-benzoquinol methylase
VCKLSYITPFPSKKSLNKIFSKKNYHDIHYSRSNLDRFGHSIKLVELFDNSTRKKILDFGCGSGDFLQLLQSHGYSPVGVEIDPNSALIDQNIIPVITPEDLFYGDKWRMTDFDVIYMNDVLAHLSDPIVLLNNLDKTLAKTGIIVIEGPLENNKSLVYFFSIFWGFLKNLLSHKPDITPPTHFIRLNASNQLMLFMQGFPKYKLLLWDVYDTGWPYINGGILKRIIANLAIFMGGKSFFNSVFGNRFRIVLSKH